MFSRLALVALAATVPQLALAVPVCDERTAIDEPTLYPWQTISALGYDRNHDGDFEARGSATVVGPYLALTCGHCVFKRNKGEWNTSDIHIIPGMYEEANNAVYPYGSRVAVVKRTNTRWADPTFPNPIDVDYGSLGYICPFEDLSTYMAMVFEYDAYFVNMSGYPTEDLPDPTRNQDQWRGAGAVEALFDRRLRYDIRSTGGASGAPVWAYNPADGRRIVGVNRGHTSDCNGLGPRLVSENEAVIIDWLAWAPTPLQKAAAGCPDILPVMTLAQLFAYFMANPTMAFTATQLNLGPSRAINGPPLRSVIQVIENQPYRWEEYASDPEEPQGPRFLRMTYPELRVLTTPEARAILTASQIWLDQPPSGNYTEIGQSLPDTAIAMPVGDDSGNFVYQSNDVSVSD